MSKSNKSTLKLKPVHVKNSKDVRALVKFVNSHYKGAIPLTTKKVISGGIKYFWVYDVQLKERIGVCAYYTKTPWLAETVKTVVDPKYRGLGYGAAISVAIEAQCVRDGFYKVMTTIYESNKAMIAIKKKQGYKIEGFHPDHERPGWHEYSLGKVVGSKSMQGKKRR